MLLLLAPPASAAGELAIVSSVRVDAPKGFYRFQPLRFSFVVRNVTAGPGTAEVISVPVRDPFGIAVDVICAGGLDVTIAAGKTFNCNAPLGTGYGSLGTYEYWADWRDTSGGWHNGELGAHQTFSLADAPLTSLNADGPRTLGGHTVGATSPVTPVTVTNTGAAALLMERPKLGGLHPRNFALATDTCSPAPVAVGATCTLGVRFTPSALGPRAATLIFTANTTPARNAVNVTGTGVAVSTTAATPTPAPTSTPAPTPSPPPGLPRLSATLSWNGKAGTRTTRFTRLRVRIPKGAEVTATCARGCSRKSLTTSKAKRGYVSLNAFIRRPWKVGTKIIVTVTQPGFIGAVKILTVRRRDDPTIATRCLPPGATAPERC